MEGSPWKSESVPGPVGISVNRAGDGPDPVVCLHGITAQHRAFTTAARLVGPARGLVGVDLRGRGDSDKPDSGYGLEAHAGDVPPPSLRLDMVFETPDDYLGFWFPDQGLTMADLPPDLADYYRYDLREVEGGYNPKCLSGAAKQDSPDVTETSPTADEMRAVRCPVALVRAAEGFFPGSRPLIPDATRDVMAEALDIRSEMALTGANHYTMMWPEYTPKWAGILRDDSWFR